MAQEQPLPPRIPVIHNAAVAGAIIAPLAMLLPPRKMDVRFFVLAGAFSLATNQLAYEYTGQSIYSRFGGRVGSVFDTGLPEGAKRTQQLLKEQREREAAQKRSQGEAEPEAQNKRGLIKDIWMGGEAEDWSRKRAEEHQKSFQEGKGMSDIILDQIMHVWSGGDSKTKADDRIPSDDGGSDKK
ncbi:hypothetical protein HRG_003054 [Hirsutella rhossiliensis]|uniref:Rhomboid family membrane protein n=1 Tax=Hirsutella rhossiliensis TaxID=111463 RepID=A0A9P8MZR8_9HYPO|nr:uncharacterized protein HRG_03054 [Hirsutella rhossiliensis]KAH0965038.1 hypothetical protein HRG_03054 [Hirsutella rhossiliensis]